MGSRFENFDIGRAVAKFLNIKDLKNFPTEMSTDLLQPVIDVGYAKASDTVAAGIDGFSLSGLSSFTVSVASASGALLPPNHNLDTLIFGLDIEINYDAAGALADNGVVLSYSGEAFVNDSAGNSVICSLEVISRVAVVGTGFRSYVAYAIGGWNNQNDPTSALVNPRSGRPIFVPAGSQFTATAFRLLAGAFPANTTGFIHVWGIQAPPGLLNNPV